MERFSIGRTFSRAFQLMSGGIGSAGLFLAIIYIANTALSAAIQPMVMKEMAAANNPADPAAGLKIFNSGWYWGSVAASLVVGALAYNGSIYGFLQVARGKQATLGECVGIAFAKLAPMLGLTVLWTLAVGLGFLALFVPGILLVTIWAVIMPVLVGEGLGPIEAFGRSRELTRSARWPVFAVLLLLVIAIYVLLFMLVGGLIGGMSLGGGLNPERLAQMVTPLGLLSAAIIGWAMAMALGAVLTSIYVELVEVKEGARSGALVDVFE